MKSVVPKENLLVWNVKDGWEPLCNFLGKPTPDGPVPYDNKTGTNFMEEYAWQSPVLKVFSCLKLHSKVSAFGK